MRVVSLLTLKWISLVLFSYILQIKSQAQILKPDLFVETDLKAGIGENPPYYSVSDQYGLFSNGKNAMVIRTGIGTRCDTSKKVSLAYGLDVSYRYDSENDFWLQQGFVKIKMCAFVFQGGLIEETFGNQDDQLSSGPYLYSENVRPMPKIALRTNGFVTLPFTGNLLEIKGYMAHGWFGEADQHVKNAFLHQKYLFIRIAEKRFPLSFILGLHHTAMWGGISPEYGHLPHNWSAFLSVFKGRMKDEFGPDLEQHNVLGNHLASYSLDINYRHRRYDFSLYWQTILEDKNGRVGVDWKNKGDGLWGLMIKRNNHPTGLQKVLVEFFNSTSQSGDQAKSGGDNYFNNYLYRSGWTYHNMTIGTPLITSPLLTGRSLETIDKINIHRNIHLENNSIRAVIAGLLYCINDNQLTLRMTYSRNYGTIAIPYHSPRDQIYSAIEYSYPSKRYNSLQFTWQAAFDAGTHLGNNAGLMLKIRKTF